MGDYCGPSECLFPCTNPQGCQKVPQVCSPGSSVPISGFTVRTSYSPVCLQLVPSTICQVPSSFGDKNTHLSGRLDSPSQGSQHATFSQGLCTTMGGTTGPSGELSEVFSPSSPGSCVFGGAARSPIPSGLPVSGTSQPCQSLYRSDLAGEVDVSSSLVSIDRITQLHSKFYPIWSPGPETSPDASVKSLGFRLDPGTQATSAPTTDLVSSTKMDSGRVPSPGNAIPGSEPDGHTFHGRQSLGLGGSFSRVSCVRTLGHSGSAASYKSIRNESSVSCHLSTQLCVAASGDNNCHRQYNSPVLSEASGGHSQPISLVLDSEGFPNLPGDRSGISKQTHSRSSEFTSRSTFTTQPGCSLGVVVEPKCIGPSLVHLGPPTDRRFCYSIQQPSSKVLLSTSGPVLGGSGCFKSEVGSTIPLFVSSIQPNPGGTSETTSVSKLQVHSGVSSETRSSVVSINARSIPRKRRHSVSATISSGPAVSTPELYVTPKRAGPKSSRCAAITKGLEKRGLHPSIQEFILKDTVNSTCQVYDAKWSVFEAWCQSHQPPLNPLVLSVSQVGQFYVHLFKDRNLSLSAILGYRSALNSVFKTQNLRKLAQDPIFTRLFQGFKRTRMSSPRSLKPPGWNLALVLHCLSASPFEPLGSIPIKFLAWKTAFLTLLGTACRRSELHALDFHAVEHDRKWSWVNLVVLPDFVAKHQASDSFPFEPRSFRLQSLGQITEDPDELVICPVRALRYYILRTSPFRGSRKRLFLPISETSKVELSANAISWWIKKLVSYAYSSASPSTLQLLQIPTQEPSLFRVTHEVRAMSSSVAWNHHQTSLQNLLKSCYWKGHTVFTDFYLRDISAVKSDKLVIASHVIASR